MAEHEFRVGDTTVAVSSERRQFGFSVRLPEGDLVELQPVGNGVFSVMRGGQKYVVAAVRQKDTYFVDIDSMLFEVTEASDESFNAGAGDHAGAKDKIYAPMPGKIVKVLVAVGDEVDVKQPMVIVEAMKMENQVNSRAKGRVKAVHFQTGDQVDTEQPIIELELAE